MKASFLLASLGSAPGLALAIAVSTGPKDQAKLPDPTITQSFEDRWLPVERMPVGTVYVKSTKESGRPLEQTTAKPEDVTRIPVRVGRIDTPPPRNICARHGLRKVKYGKRWRCKR